MLALSSHHFIERTPSGEDAWRSSSMLPDDRKVLGALRSGKSVAELMTTLVMEPSTLEVVVHRLARRGFVRIDTAAPLVSVGAEPAQAEPSQAVPDTSQVSAEDALFSLLARHAPSDLDQTDPDLDPVQRAAETGPEREPSLGPSAVRIYDESPLPVAGSSHDLHALMEALEKGPTQAESAARDPSPSIPHSGPDNTAVHDPQAIDNLMRALMGEGAHPAARQADLSLPGPGVHRDAQAGPESRMPAGAVSSPKFLRMKDAKEPARQSADWSLPSLPPKPSRVAATPSPHDRAAMDAARREHALKQRADREAQAENRRAEMAARRTQERKQEEGDTLLGMSARLRRALEDQKKG